MSTQPESRLQKRIQKALEKKFSRSFWRKIHGGAYQRSGIPDLLGCVAGFYIAIEVKCPGKERTVTPLQQATIKSIKNAGGIAFVSSTVEDAVQVSVNHLNSKIYGQHKMGRIWQNMKSRCYNENTPGYKNYGGKGILICDSWLQGVFFFWQDMGFPPQEEDREGDVIRYSIDRINSNGNYAPGNCQWLSLSENSGKTNRNLHIKHKGETKTCTEWCKIYKINFNTLQGRLSRGWSIHKALTTRPDKRFHSKN